MNLNKKYLATGCCFCLLLALILSIVDYWCFNNEFYQMEYQQLNTAASIGMSESDLNKTTDVLLEYLKDKEKTLDVEALVDGEIRQVFNQKEIAHMEDVRNLYLNTMLVRNIAIGVAIFCLIILFLKKGLNNLYQGYIKALIIYGLIFGVIGLFCLIDFDSFWTSFHELFFTNDLWLLNPKTDILIMMVPSKFFFDLCVTIVFSIFVSLALLFVIFFILNKKVFNHA